MAGSTDLRREYRRFEAVLPQHSLMASTSRTLHQPGGDGKPFCKHSADEWRAVDSREALRYGAVPCRHCYGAVADYFAADDDSPVERRDADEEHDHSADAKPVDAVVADGGLKALTDRVLSAKTEEVLTASGSKIYHAPSGDGPLCNSSGNFRRADLDVLDGHHRPCAECFDLDD